MSKIEDEQIFQEYKLTGYLGEKDAPATGSYSPEKPKYQLKIKNGTSISH